MPVLTAIPDHLVVAAATLDHGCDWIEEKLGMRPVRGGQHVAMGTHNAVLALGRRLYLEVIAIDPSLPAPPRPRWFDLDAADLQATLADGPRLVTWVARTDDIAAFAQRVPDLGAILPMTRGEWSWRITVPADGHRPSQGLVPTLLQWDGSAHPADRLPESGCRLVALAGEHPDPAPVRATIAALGLSDALKVTYARSPRLAAMIRTPRGTAAL